MEKDEEEKKLQEIMHRKKMSKEFSAKRLTYTPKIFDGVRRSRALQTLRLRNLIGIRGRNISKEEDSVGSSLLNLSFELSCLNCKNHGMAAKKRVDRFEFTNGVHLYCSETLTSTNNPDWKSFALSTENHVNASAIGVNVYNSKEEELIYSEEFDLLALKLVGEKLSHVLQFPINSLILEFRNEGFFISDSKFNEVVFDESAVSLSTLEKEADSFGAESPEMALLHKNPDRRRAVTSMSVNVEQMNVTKDNSADRSGGTYVQRLSARPSFTIPRKLSSKISLSYNIKEFLLLLKMERKLRESEREMISLREELEKTLKFCTQKSQVGRYPELEMKKARSILLNEKIRECKEVVKELEEEIGARRTELLGKAHSIEEGQLALEQWKAAHTRDLTIKERKRLLHEALTAALLSRRKQMVADAFNTFPITTTSEGKSYICGLYFPNSDFSIISSDKDEDTFAAFGRICSLVNTCARYMHVQLPYPILERWSEIAIFDRINKDEEMSYLVSYGRTTKSNNEYAVYLLNKDIESLLNSQGIYISKPDLRRTLPNMQRLHDAIGSIDVRASPKLVKKG